MLCVPRAVCASALLVVCAFALLVVCASASLLVCHCIASCASVHCKVCVLSFGSGECLSICKFMCVSCIASNVFLQCRPVAIEGALGAEAPPPPPPPPRWSLGPATLNKLLMLNYVN